MYTSVPHSGIDWLSRNSSLVRKKNTTKTTPIMPALLGHNAFTYYAQNYASIIRMSLTRSAGSKDYRAIIFAGRCKIASCSLVHSLQAAGNSWQLLLQIEHQLCYDS